MYKLPVVSAKNFFKMLLAYGCVPVSTNGSHFKVMYPKSGKSAPIPIHGNKDIKRDFAKLILAQLGIDYDDFVTKMI